MKLERFKTDRKDVLRSAGYALAIGATLYSGCQFSQAYTEFDNSEKHFTLSNSTPDGTQTPFPATEEEKRIYERMLKNPYTAPPLISLTPDQQHFLLKAEVDRQQAEEHVQNGLGSTLLIILPAFLAAARGKITDNEPFFAFK